MRAVVTKKGLATTRGGDGHPRISLASLVTVLCYGFVSCVICNCRTISRFVLDTAYLKDSIIPSDLASVLS
jgi:hypothetical protein